MKIIQLRFKNLNSLSGEWEIDLTHPDYVSNGIFAITGPTGSGKSTILDAICLALYGRTPRLNKITKSSNEIMSRQTGECFAEVVFETQAGRFRCHWSQHRAHKKEDGELQSPKHEIANATSGEIYQSKLRDVADEIVLQTGLDFERFTRSMLLAQGDFSAFLQAAPDERAPILEQITGTEIYTEISSRVHDRNRQEKRNLELLQAEIAGILIVSPEQEKAIIEKLKTDQLAEQALTSQIEKNKQALLWLRSLELLRQEIAQLAIESDKLATENIAFEPKREQLNQALKAASLDGLYTAFTFTKNQQEKDLSALQQEENALPQLKESVTTQSTVLKDAQLKTKQVKKEHNDAEPILRRVRSLDQQLANQTKSVTEIQASCQQSTTKITELMETKKREQNKFAQEEAQLKKIHDYLVEHAHDEWLLSELAGVEQQLKTFITKQTEISEKEREKFNAIQQLEATKTKCDDSKKLSLSYQSKRNTLIREIDENKSALTRILGEHQLSDYQKDKDQLLEKKALVARIMALETHRAKLQDQHPCPLCGALDHPYASGNIPTPDAIDNEIKALTDKISLAEAILNTLKEQQTHEYEIRLALEKSQMQHEAETQQQQNVQDTIANVSRALSELKTNFDNLKQTVVDQLQPLGLVVDTKTDMASIITSLHARKIAWLDQIKLKTDVEKNISNIQSELKRIDAVIEIQQGVLIEKQKQLETQEAERITIRDERLALFGDKNPDKEATRLNLSILAAETAEKDTRDALARQQQRLVTAQTRVDSLNQEIVQRKPELAAANNQFNDACSAAGFATEEQFKQAQLSHAQKEELALADKQLKDRLTHLNARLTDRIERLHTELEKKITDQSSAYLEPQIKAENETLRELRDVIAGLKHQLQNNRAAQQRIEQKQIKIDAQKRESQRWGNLHDLIGSSDGKKYRNFVQGLTFEIMISHANQQLQKMSDRYLLDRDQAQPLELNVIDSYQAGAIRSTKNLSGGESFIVSLALALGLSQMASKNVRVDSLFLDEGFGTLDDEALDSALEALSGLQQSGKLIGVISHVSALKERISTQIQINPQTGGKSQITGPGCSGLN